MLKKNRIGCERDVAPSQSQISLNLILFLYIIIFKLITIFQKYGIIFNHYSENIEW